MHRLFRSCPGGYSAGYDACFWSEALDDDAFEWFKERGGLTAENGQVLRDKILSRGNTVDLATPYRVSRGKDPSVEPLLENRGIEVRLRARLQKSDKKGWS